MTDEKISDDARAAPDAQYEIRVYAEAVGKIVAAKFPRTWEVADG